MRELGVNEYDKVKPLFQAMSHHLIVNGILEGTVPARIYADDGVHPQAALACGKRRFCLAGRAEDGEFNQAIRQLFADTIYPQALQAGEEMFVLYYAPDSWESQLDVILKDKYPIKAQRQFYAFRELKNDWRAMLPEGFTVQLVDRALLEEKHLKNLDELAREMCSERESVEDFLDKSVGVCLVHGDEIAGWCLSEYNSAGRCEVGIETLEPYQRRGLGTLMTSALVELVRSRGISQIGWHCDASNAASAATALKVGFEKAGDYAAYMAWFDEIDNLAIHGNMCIRRQQYEEALTWFERAFARGEAKPWAYWGAACASALLGQSSAAFRYLAQAMDKGFADVERLKSSAHLRSLHGTQEWQALVERVEKHAQT